MLSHCYDYKHLQTSANTDRKPKKISHEELNTSQSETNPEIAQSSFDHSALAFSFGEVKIIDEPDSQQNDIITQESNVLKEGNMMNYSDNTTTEIAEKISSAQETNPGKIKTSKPEQESAVT